jgi:hypothetical protein
MEESSQYFVEQIEEIKINRSDVIFNIFPFYGDLYFETPTHDGKIKIDKDKLFEFLKQFERKEKK